MAKSVKQHKISNHKYVPALVLADPKINLSYRSLLRTFFEVVHDKLGYQTNIESNIFMGATEIAIQMKRHLDYLESVCIEILTLSDDYLYSEFGVFIAKNAKDNVYSCLSFKIKRGNGYFIQISRYIYQDRGIYKANIYIDNKKIVIESDTILGLFLEIDCIQSDSQKTKSSVDLTDFNPNEVHFDHSEQHLIEVQT